MQTCPSCGQENPAGFRLCGMCGASLTVATAPAREERKVVSVFFCDLVGFTARAEQLDPEDVRAVLGPYHEHVRSELERHGGTVEKFIGDAVMALFGAPTAHEDDPERAVRAAMAIRDFAVEDGLELRIGITSGEALVSLDTDPSTGEGMASGDVVNTAARLQSAAPVNGILVDEMTYRATRHIVEYERADSVEAKGKSEPITVRHALQVRSRLGVDLAHDARSELVGRDQELGVLRDALTRVRSARTSQLVTLVGIPGIGKSRLVYELSRIVESDPDLITWRQGRCLAYGDGVTLWALGEIVKAQAGIHEQDPPAEAAAKIRTAVEEALPTRDDVVWVESHVLALIGLATESELGGDRRGEAFSAWRHFFEGMAEQRPLVLVFEDLHWADESLLDFVDELVDWVSDVPLLVVGTARPELLERRPNWGGGKLNATTLALRPLSDEETARLLGQLLERPLLVAEEQEALLERTGGNPLYAEQFAELYLERGSTDELPLPETLQGIIAARLDGLAGNEKDALLDAAVIGKVFWVGALGRDDGDAGATLHALERKGFVRRQRRSSVEGETELAFAHALVRDVAYGQIPRADRSYKHRRIAEWIEGLGRAEDHAEMLAYHWSSALELATATGVDITELAARTRVALREAGDRAHALNAFVAAEHYYARSLELMPSDDPERAQLLFRRARALYDGGDESREEALEEARDALIANGDRETAAEAAAFLTYSSWRRGRGDRVDRHLAQAEMLVSGTAQSAAKARVLAISARIRMLRADYDEAIRLGREALAIAEELSLAEIQAHALNSIGCSLAFLSQGGDAEMERGLEIARAANSREAAFLVHNHAEAKWSRGEVGRAVDGLRESEALSRHFGDPVAVLFTRATVAQAEMLLGDWSSAEPALDDLIAAFGRSPHYMESVARSTRAEFGLARGDVAGALEDSRLALERARAIGDAQVLIPSLVGAAHISALAGRTDEARATAREVIDLVRQDTMRGAHLPEVAVVADHVGLRSELRALVELRPGSPWKEADLAGLDGDFGRAADVYERMGVHTLAAECRLLAARELIARGRRAEGEAQLEQALTFYRSVGATYYLERAEKLLARTA